MHHSINILAIDDNQDNLITLRAVLKDSFPHATILTTDNGRDGIRIAGNEDPDVILLDILMPDMDGYEVCRVLKKQEETKDIPVVFLTAIRGDSKSRIEALEAGGDAFLSKPFDESELIAQIRAMVKIKVANNASKNEKIRLEYLVSKRTMDLRKELTIRKRIEDALRNLATGYIDLSGHEFFQSVCENIGRNLKLDMVFVGELIQKDEEIKIIGGYSSEGGSLPSMYSIKDTPCKEVMGGSLCAYPDTVQKKFPHDQFLIDMGIEAYIGAPLMKSDDNTVGILVGLSKSKIVDVELSKNYFNVFTDRIVAEFQKIHAEERLEESEKRFRLSFDSSAVGMGVISKEGMFIMVNQSTCDILKYTRRELMKKNFIEITHPDDRERSKNRFLKCLEDKKAYNIEKQYLTKDGNIRWGYTTVSPIFDENGVLEYAIAHLQDMTPRKKTEFALIKAKEKAEESEKLKSAFLSNMSHEIRTPMNGILGFLELLQDPDNTAEEEDMYFSIVKKNSDRLLNTINDIIEVSKIEAGQAVVRYSDVNIKSFVKGIFESFSKEASEKGLQYTLKDTANMPNGLYRMDIAKTESILSNFIKNAIKFTAKGSVELKVVERDNEIVFSVKDTGYGIPKERHKAIFDRFVLADMNITRAYDGSGLGLSICKSYAKMLNGRIWLESEEGKGSTFYFAFNIESEKILVKGEKEKIDDKDILIGKHILVVEDEDSNYEFIHEILQRKRVIVARAIGGEEAIKILEKDKAYDVILMDIKLPGINGYEATQRIRKFMPKIPIIAQTAFAMEGDREKAIQSGCSDYLAKPIKRTTLIDMIIKHLKE